MPLREQLLPCQSAGNGASVVEVWLPSREVERRVLPIDRVLDLLRGVGCL